MDMNKLSQAIDTIESNNQGEVVEHKLSVECRNVKEVFVVKTSLSPEEIVEFLKEALVDLEAWDDVDPLEEEVETESEESSDDSVPKKKRRNL